MRPRTHKYGAVRTGGYASKLEARRAAELRFLEQAGEITDLQEQVLLQVQPEGCELISYRADFSYCEQGLTVIDDAKGLQTAEFRIKWKLARWKYPRYLFRLSCGRRNIGGFEIRDYPPREVIE